jgi:hypothetical protein
LHNEIQAQGRDDRREWGIDFGILFLYIDIVNICVAFGGRNGGIGRMVFAKGAVKMYIVEELWP